jgi:hypothetical protein
MCKIGLKLKTSMSAKIWRGALRQQISTRKGMKDNFLFVTVPLGACASFLFPVPGTVVATTCVYVREHPIPLISRVLTLLHSATFFYVVWKDAQEPGDFQKAGTFIT